jgi:thiamine biosynthesis lipoprotein
MSSNQLIKRGKWIFPLLVFFCVACENQQTLKKQLYPFQYQGQTMGTSFSIKATFIPKAIEEQALKQQIDDLLTNINKQMSTYIADSELSIFNNMHSAEWQPVSNGLYAVIDQAQQISKLTSGAFDISVGPLVNLWGFGPGLHVEKLPEEELIKLTLNQVGYRNLILTVSPAAIKKSIPELYLDLSALAKGYAVDQVAELLERNRLFDYLVEIGGELRLKGKNISAKPWRIAIEKPTPERQAVQRVLSISDVAMATSGNYRNFFSVGGESFAHTIDPRTGWPVKYDLASVTVISASAMRADALATAFMVLGAKKGMDFAEQHKIAVFFIVKTDAGFNELSSTAFSKYIRG